MLALLRQLLVWPHGEKAVPPSCPFSVTQTSSLRGEVAPNRCGSRALHQGLLWPLSRAGSLLVAMGGACLSCRGHLPTGKVASARLTAVYGHPWKEAVDGSLGVQSNDQWGPTGTPGVNPRSTSSNQVRAPRLLQTPGARGSNFLDRRNAPQPPRPAGL